MKMPLFFLIDFPSCGFKCNPQKGAADYIIDMGPEGGDGGGKVIAKGTPEQVAEAEGSYTGKYVKKYLQK